MADLAAMRATLAGVWRPTSWELASPLPAPELRARLDADLAPLIALGRPGRPQVRGWAAPSGIRLWVVWPSQRLAAGVRRHLSGVVVDAPDGSVVRGRFAVSRSDQVGLAAAVVFSLVVIVSGFVPGVVPGSHAAAPLWWALSPVVALPAVVVWSLWGARHDEEMLRTWVAARAGLGTD